MHLLTASGLPPGGSSAVHIYTQTVHRTTQNKQCIEQHKFIHRTTQKFWGKCGPCSVFCELYPGICLTTEEKARKNLSQVSRSVPVGTMNYHHHHQNYCTFT